MVGKVIVARSCVVACTYYFIILITDTIRSYTRRGIKTGRQKLLLSRSDDNSRILYIRSKYTEKTIDACREREIVWHGFCQYNFNWNCFISNELFFFFFLHRRSLKCFGERKERKRVSDVYTRFRRTLSRVSLRHVWYRTTRSKRRSMDEKSNRKPHARAPEQPRILRGDVARCVRNERSLDEQESECVRI